MPLGEDFNSSFIIHHSSFIIHPSSFPPPPTPDYENVLTG
jgi:hypothetical protein